jgi:hypothetical protein
MPVAPSVEEPYPPHNLSYRAVPDLGYVPVLFSFSTFAGTRTALPFPNGLCGLAEMLGLGR